MATSHGKSWADKKFQVGSKIEGEAFLLAVKKSVVAEFSAEKEHSDGTDEEWDQADYEKSVAEVMSCATFTELILVLEDRIGCGSEASDYIAPYLDDAFGLT